MTTEKIAAGDSVFHKPTGETWYVLGVSRDRLCVAGWPPTIADIADCDLVTKGTGGITEDELEHRQKTFGDGWV